MTEQADFKRESEKTNDAAPKRTIVPIIAVFIISIYLALSFGLSVNAIVKTTKYQTTYNAEQVGKYVTLIGDSISYMSQEELRDALPGVDLEVKGGMQFARYTIVENAWAIASTAPSPAFHSRSACSAVRAM